MLPVITVLSELFTATTFPINSKCKSILLYLNLSATKVWSSEIILTPPSPTNRFPFSKISNFVAVNSRSLLYESFRKKLKKIMIKKKFFAILFFIYSNQSNTT